MQRKFITFKRKSLGQGMMEYIIIVALIAVAAIGVYSVFGQTVRNQTAGLAKELSGNDAQTAITNAGNTSNTAQQRANTMKGLSSYNLENDQGGGNGGGGGGGGGTP
jgi:Flp pilus assembly pilin Flp